MKSIFSILLSAALLAGCFQTAAAAQPFSATRSSLEESAVISRPEERAVVIVTLSEPALMDIYHNNVQSADDFSQFLLSQKGQQTAERIRSQQQTLRRQIQKQCPDADFSSARSYTAITNALTVTVNLSDVERLCQMSGVRSAVISSIVSETTSVEDDSSEEVSEPSEEVSEPSEEVSEPSEEVSEPSEEVGEPSEEESEPAPKEYDTYGMASKASIKVTPAYEAGFTGKGTLIAVIDNEFNVRHNVFSVVPEKMRYSEAVINAIGNSIGFGIDPKYTMDHIFYNGKIVYAYDYGENDNICRTGGMQHGTHVAGIAAGNNDGQGELDFKGTAYDAQLAFFKIADKSGQLQDEAILAALDDAVKLNPDVINCSYGAIEYLTHDYEGKQLYEKLMEYGTAIVAAAGNDAYNSYAMGSDEIPVTYTNYSTICSPSSLNGAFSVAASVPDAVYATHYTMIFNDSNRVPTNMIYADLSFEEVYEDGNLSVRSRSVPQDEEAEEDDAVEIDRVDYVYLGGIGQLNDFKGKKLNDKIVIVNESAIPIETLVKRSIQYNCYAVIVIQREKNSLLKQNNDISDFFVYSIDHAQKEYFEQHPKGTVAICSSQKMKEEPQRNAGTITEYSSYGTKADLTLKPDITAPGDNILSSIDKQGFGVMSGTSMASPCAAGAYAVMKQYIFSNSYCSIYLGTQTQEFIYQLLMSTADILSYRDTEKPLYYSPRLQGAGGINLEKAIQTRAFLSVDDARPSVSLGESTEGTYRFRFSVSSFSSETQQFTPDYILQTDGYRLSEHEQERAHYVNSFIPDDIRSRAKVTFSVDGQPVQTISVEPFETLEVEVTLTLDPAYVTSHSQLFSNGFFVDGFICMNSEEAVDLHLPFTGFCGDWSKADIFPQNIYHDDALFPVGQSTLSIVSAFDSGSSFAETAGVNVFGYKDLPTNISFGQNSLRSYLNIPETVYVNPCVLLPNIHVLRDVMDYTISIYDKKGVLLFCQNFGDISSYFNPSGAQYAYLTEPSKRPILNEFFEFADTLTEGEYTYIVSASTVGIDGNPQRTEHFMFPIHVDNTAPSIQEYYLQKTDDGKLYLHLYAKDNNILQGIRLSAIQYDNFQKIVARFDLREDMLQYWGSSDKFVEYHYDAASDLYYFRYDLTEYQPFIQSKMDEKAEVYSDGDVTIIFENETDYSNIEKDLVLLEAVDGAYNCGEDNVIDINHYGEARLKLTDENGQPLAGVLVTHNGQIYESDRDGLIQLRNLPLWKNECYIVDDYLSAETNRPYIRFFLGKDNWKIDNSVVLKHVPQSVVVSESSLEPSRHVSEASESTETKREPTIIVNFHTGDSGSYGLLVTALAGLVSVCLTVCIGRRRKKKHQ